MTRTFVVAALALLLAPSAAAAPGTTEREFEVERTRFAFDGKRQLELEIDFNRAPNRLQQVLVGIHVVGSARAHEDLKGARYTGRLRISKRPDGTVKWKAGRTYPLLVVFCSWKPGDADSAGQGHCTWIRTKVFLRRR